jgi:hypothetical protein
MSCCGICLGLIAFVWAILYIVIGLGLFTFRDEIKPAICDPFVD